MQIDPRAWEHLLRIARKRPGHVLRVTHEKGG